MKYYLVTLMIHLDGYEKSTKSSQAAINWADARYQALVGETHNTPLTRDEYDNGDEWWDDCMLYRVSHVKVVTADFHNTFNEMFD